MSPEGSTYRPRPGLSDPPFTKFHEGLARVDCAISTRSASIERTVVTSQVEMKRFRPG